MQYHCILHQGNTYAKRVSFKDVMRETVIVERHHCTDLTTAQEAPTGRMKQTPGIRNSS
jgi:uncharacterized protein YcfJ